MEAPERTQPPHEPRQTATAGAADEATGLPWLKTWPAVYAVVLASFVLWVGLLFALGVIFR